MSADTGKSLNPLEKSRLSAFLRTLKPPPERCFDLDPVDSVMSTDSDFLATSPPLPKVGPEYAKISIDLPAEVPNMDITPFLETSYIERDIAEAELECSEAVAANRRDYIAAIEANDCERQRREAVISKIAEIEKLMQTKSVDAWRSFELNVHETLQQKSRGRKLCEVDRCANSVFPGSRFCSAHILNDPDQKLFVKCEACGRPHPRGSKCFLCPL